MEYTREEQKTSESHYNDNPELFNLFLDKHVKYSCGLYCNKNDSLDDAQDNHLEFIAKTARITKGDSVLDVGCGWGSTTFFLAEKYNCKVTGVTPSDIQYDYLMKKINEKNLHSNVTIIKSPIQEVPLSEESFDAVIFLESLIHMKEQVEIVSAVYKCLKGGGICYISDSFFKNEKVHNIFNQTDLTQFATNGIFGFAQLVPLTEFIKNILETRFQLISMQDITPHYHKTIQDWIVNIENKFQEMDSVAPGWPEKYLKYLKVTNTGWGFTTNNVVLQLRKNISKGTFSSVEPYSLSSVEIPGPPL